MSSVTYCLIIEAFLATLCVHEYFLSYSCSRFKFIFVFHEHIYTFCIFYIFLDSCLFHMAFQILVRYDAYPHITRVFLSLDASIFLWNWNQSNRITKNKVMAFSCQLVDLPILPRDSLKYSFSSALSPYLTLVLCTPLNIRF